MNKQIANALYIERCKKKQSVREVSHDTGIDKNTVTKFENGEIGNFGLLHKLLKYYGISIQLKDKHNNVIGK